ncbi:MAG: LytTR family transcriptional regulator DNA-binding domain-containing protein [Robiginitomaculum sp.]|nr:LytTR family transcriptional regulator DNA-binding domain-containing protein [Robiginitomaculum sp.]
MSSRFWQNKIIRRDIILVLFIGTILAIISPFGATSHLPIIGGLAYWVGILAWGWAAGRFVGPAMLRILPKMATGWFYLLVSVIMAVVILPAILIVQYVIGSPIPPNYWLNLYFMIWIISLCITGVSYLIERPDKAPKDGSDFMLRIPAKIADDTLYAISSEDHYLRIQTARGSDLILMRLGDAMAELDGYDGMQVHRSWWVARQGIEKIEREQNRIFLILRDGTKVPVSRTFAPKIRAAGWLG